VNTNHTIVDVGLPGINDGLEMHDHLGAYGPGVTIDVVRTPHMSHCGQCERFAAISHIVRVFCGENEFHEYDLCYRCACGDVDPAWLARLVGQDTAKTNYDLLRKERMDRYWAHGARAR